MAQPSGYREKLVNHRSRTSSRSGARIILVWYPVEMHDERDIKPCFRAVVKRLNKRAGPIQNLVEIGKVTRLELGVDGLPVDRDFKRPAARGDKHELGNRLLEGQ